MTAGSLDNEPVGLDWTCSSITFNNIYIVLWERRSMCFLRVCVCAVALRGTVKAIRVETNNPNSSIMCILVTHS